MGSRIDRPPFHSLPWAELTGRLALPLPIPLPRAKLTAAVYPAALPISALPFHSLPRAASYRINRRRYAALAQGKERPAGKGSRVDRRPRCCLALLLPFLALGSRVTGLTAAGRPPSILLPIPCPGQSYRIDRPPSIPVYRRPAALPWAVLPIGRPERAAAGLTAALLLPFHSLPCAALGKVDRR